MEYHRAVLDEMICLANCDKITLALALIDQAHLTYTDVSSGDGR